MLRDEVRDILRELSLETGVRDVSLVAAEKEPAGDFVVVGPLGGGLFLVARLESEPTEPGPGPLGPSLKISAAIERSVRALRSAARRWGEPLVPAASPLETVDKPGRRLVLERIESYLKALAASSRARNVIVCEHGDITAAANEPSELDSERISFVLKQVEADAARREDSSFGEITGEDHYVRSFWVNAALVVFFDGPWAPDFVRHRARQVCRELGHLLGDLEPPPSAPASVAPVPKD